MTHRTALLSDSYRLGEMAATVVNNNEIAGFSMHRMHRLDDVLDRQGVLEDILGAEAVEMFEARSKATLCYQIMPDGHVRPREADAQAGEHSP